MKLHADNAQTLKFAVEINGTDVEKCTSRFIVESKGFLVAFPGVVKMENGKSVCLFNIPGLKSVLRENIEDEIPCSVEVYVEGKLYFRPWSQKVLVERKIDVSVREEDSSSTVSPTIVSVSEVQSSFLESAPPPKKETTEISQTEILQDSGKNVEPINVEKFLEAVNSGKSIVEILSGF
jgi:hypothetical protein